MWREIALPQTSKLTEAVRILRKTAFSAIRES